ncbi:hypothetical protein D3C81_1845290 [compost metagenome]
MRRHMTQALFGRLLSRYIVTDDQHGRFIAIVIRDHLQFIPAQDRARGHLHTHPRHFARSNRLP